MSIEVGVMVEIINSEEPAHGNLIGRRGKVREAVILDETEFFLIDGVNTDMGGYRPAFHASHLRPIKDDDASWDNEVWKTIGWKPKQEVTCDA